jgi:hypothetical protein
MCQLTLSTYLVMPTRRVTGYPGRGGAVRRFRRPTHRMAAIFSGARPAGGAVADRRRDHADAKTGVIESTLAKAAHGTRACG